MDTNSHDVLPRPRVFTDHHHGDTNVQDVLLKPRVYTDHHHGDPYSQDVFPRPRVHEGDPKKNENVFLEGRGA
jgi:hypothetical protein